MDSASERFEAACLAAQEERQSGGIGTLNEKTLHAILKRYIEPDVTKHEVPVGSYFADVFRGGHIYEIQTGSFTPLRPKLELLLDYTDVTVVYPMAAVKYLSWTDPETGEVTAPRRSPKKMKPIDSVFELIKIKYALDNPRFHLKLVMLELHEMRLRDGRRSRDGKRGSHRTDRFPTKLLGEIDLHEPRDFDIFIPEGLGGEFTLRDFAKAAKVSYGCAQRAVSILVYLERLVPCGKNGREKLFARA